MSKKISQLPSQTSLTGEELLALVSNGSNSKIKVSDFFKSIDKTALNLQATDISGLEQVVKTVANVRITKSEW